MKVEAIACDICKEIKKVIYRFGNTDVCPECVNKETMEYLASVVFSETSKHESRN